MPDEIEMQARALNEADNALRKAMRIYADEGYDLAGFCDRIDELNDEEQVLAP